jgi:hypothetical protein
MRTRVEIINSICFVLLSDSGVMRFLGCGIVYVVFLTLNLVIEITPNPKECLCTQKWSETLPRHEFCGKELGRGCDPNTIYNCTQYGAPAILGYPCIKEGGRYRPSCSPTTFATCEYSKKLLRCKSYRLCMSEKGARIAMNNTYGENWEKTLLS